MGHSYVKKKLEHGLSRIWQVSHTLAFLFSTYSVLSISSLITPTCFHGQDVQLKVKAYLLGTDMSNFKYDDFIVVLDVISRYGAASSLY